MMATFRYFAKGGESLLDIARDYTLSPAYWTALAEFNGAPEWQDAGYRLNAGEVVGIPDTWLKPGLVASGAPAPGQVAGPLDITVTGSGSRAGMPAVPSAWLIGAGALVLVLALATGRRR